jgi:hypothetical protein
MRVDTETKSAVNVKMDLRGRVMMKVFMAKIGRETSLSVERVT